MTPFLSRLVLAILSVLLLAAALYCGLWVFSSASLAFSACNGEYSLFAESFRCRQPYVAVLLAIVLFAASVLSLYVRNRVGRASRGAP